jgi:SAM-dependent methyltransferase
MPKLRDWYDTPLYYDIIFDADTPKEGAFLDALHERYGRAGQSRQLLEPACGSGRLVSEMARRGWKVSGFDGNARMLDFAKERVQQQELNARLWEDWMQSFELPKVQTFDFAHCLVSTFKYLLKEQDSVACLQRISAALKPGAIFALGVHLTNYSSQQEDHERWVAERDGIKVTCNTHTWPADRKKRLEDLRTRLTIEDKGRRHVQETRWQFRTYNAKQMRALLAKVPDFELVACYDFTYDLLSPRELDDSYADVVLILKKKQSSPQSVL